MNIHFLSHEEVCELTGALTKAGQILNLKKNGKTRHKVRSARLIVTEDGTPMTKAMLRGRFDVARDAAGAEKVEFQMRDLRAKAGTD